MPDATPARFEFVEEDAEPYLLHTDFNKSPRNRMKLVCIVRMLNDGGVAKNARILEVGCGLGNVAIPLASLGYEVTAVDIHEPSLATARQRNPFPNLKFGAEDATQMDLGRFDVVIMSDVLEHIKGYRDVFGTIARAMKPGSLFILTVPNGWSLCEILARPSYRIKPTRIGRKIVGIVKKILRTKDTTTANDETPHVNFFTHGQLTKLFDETSMRVEKFYHFFQYWTFVETFFSQREIPKTWARRDFEQSFRLSPAWCAEFCLLIRKPASTPRQE